MKRLYTAFILSALSVFTTFSQILFSGADGAVVEIKPDANTGLDGIYVLKSLDGVTATYLSSAGNTNVKWYSYGQSGGGFAEPVESIEFDGAATSVKSPAGNRGYIIEDGATRYYFWLVDYSSYRFSLNGVTIPAEQDCGLATLDIDAECKPIVFYSITGVPKTLSRDIQILHSTLEWSEEELNYIPAERTVTIDNIEDHTVLTAPLCNTVITIEGDRFLKAWGEAVSYTTDTYETKSIEVHTTAVQEERENDNEQKEESATLGGSAPANITFTSYTTDAVVHKEWQISKDPEFSTIDLRFNEDELNYSFRDNGTFYVKFVASNSDASCTAESEVYTVAIGESVLECPNAFSPDSSPGVNDEWKVSYKSIVSFKCWIFDRYGIQMISFDDPSQGWDGKYKGRFVKPGVYYYVIEAAGADGKSYKMKGDINIIKSTNPENHENVE